jgi:thiamine kinase-like enzyme
MLHCRFNRIFSSRKDLNKEVEASFSLYQQLKEEFPVVLCHMDPRIENIIYNESAGM